MLINLVCPNCGAPMEVDDSNTTISCPHCGNKVINQKEVIQVEQHVVVEHKKAKDPHTLIVNYKSSDKSVKLVIAISAIKRKDVIISGQKMQYILAPGQYRIVLKIGKINYNRDIVVPKDGTPVEIIASWAGRANISIDQPLYDPSEVSAPTGSGNQSVNVKTSKPYEERTYIEKVFRKGMIAPWIIFGVLFITGIANLSTSPAGGLITLLAAILICPFIIELICKYVNPSKVKLIKIIIFIVVGVLGIVGVSVTAAQSPSKDSASTSNSSVSSNIRSFSFSRTDDVYLNAGKTDSNGWVDVSVKDRNSFTPEDVIFVSADPNIATVSYSHDALTTYLYYDITGVNAGETEVYVTDNSGTVVSEKIKVIVTDDRVFAESVSLTCSKTELSLGESATILVDFLPNNTTQKDISWVSSDESVATVSNGVITAIAGGTTTISATTENDITESVVVTVDASKRAMKLRVTHPRQDDVNIGDEWSYIDEVNGENAQREYSLSVGDTLNFHSKYTESDNNPDVGEASASYTVTEDDLVNGFTVTFDVYVTENGGKNKGEKAHFVATYVFTP